MCLSIFTLIVFPKTLLDIALCLLITADSLLELSRTKVFENINVYCRVLTVSVPTLLSVT